LCSEVWNLSAVRTACRKIGTAVNSDRVVLERDHHDVGDRAEDRELFFAEEVDRAVNQGQQLGGWGGVDREVRREDRRFRLLVSSFVVLESYLHSKQVSFFMYGILHNL